MKTVRAASTGYYSLPEALRAAEQLIQVLQAERERGNFVLEDVTLKARESSVVFSGEEYLAFALRGVRQAIQAMVAKGPEPTSEDSDLPMGQG